MLSDDSDEDEPEPEPESDDDDASESEFEVESEEESEEEDDDASDDDFSAEESESAPRKRRKKPAAAPAAAPARVEEGAAGGRGEGRPVTLRPRALPPRGRDVERFKKRLRRLCGRPSAAGNSSSPGRRWLVPRSTPIATSSVPRLAPERRRDASGRAPSDPLYDPTTLKLPAGFPKCVDADGRAFAVSPGQAQWWRFKASHFDAVVMFKMGKFYELFEMDAHVGAADLGLAYMKGEQPHCGFPEKNHAANAERLARAGHRVVVVEQTETPAARREEGGDQVERLGRAPREGGRLTLGTLVDDAMCRRARRRTSCSPSSKIRRSLEKYKRRRPRKARRRRRVDCASGRFRRRAARRRRALGLRAALVALAPVEIVAPAEGLLRASRERRARPRALGGDAEARAGRRALASAEGALQRLGGEIFLEGGFGSAPGRARGVRVARARRRSRRRARRVRRDDVLSRIACSTATSPPRPRRGSGGAERERRRGRRRRKSDHPGERFVALDAAALEARGAPRRARRGRRIHRRSSRRSTGAPGRRRAFFAAGSAVRFAPPPPSPRASARSRTCAVASTPSAARARRFGARRTRSAS